MKISAILLVFLLAPLCVSGAEVSQGSTIISGNLTDGTPVKIEVSTVDVTSQYTYQNALIWGGDFESETEVTMPRTVISEMDLRVGNKKIIVPLSAYSDLGNPHDASVENTKSGFMITIIGGDAGSSYKAVLVFEGEQIKGRKVNHGEFPDEVWEETDYSFNNDEQM